MDELIQLIFFALIIIASMAEAGARKRKAQRRQSQERSRAQAPMELPRETEWEAPSRESLPEVQNGALGRGAEQDSAETMVPRDLWEEIQTMARGGRPQEVQVPAEGNWPSEEPAGIPSPGIPLPPATGEEPSLWDVAEDLRDEEALLVRRVPSPDLVGRERAAPRAAPSAHDERPAGSPAQGEAEASGVPLGTPADLRRAILAREIFGRPRGLARGGGLPMEDG